MPRLTLTLATLVVAVAAGCASEPAAPTAAPSHTGCGLFARLAASDDALNSPATVASLRTVAHMGLDAQLTADTAHLAATLEPTADRPDGLGAAIAAAEDPRFVAAAGRVASWADEHCSVVLH